MMSENTDEIELVERVVLRIGMAESDEQLQSALARFLPPVLLKLNSQTEGVRKKVLELLVHINKRLKSRPKVQLPVKELLEQYLNKENHSFVTNFTSLYIKTGYPRLDGPCQSEYLPMLLSCMDNKPAAQQEIFVQLFIPSLQYLKLPDNDDKKKELFKFHERPEVAALMLEVMMDFLLLLYGPGGRQGPERVREDESGDSTPMPGAPGPAEPAPNTTAPGGIPAGLSESAYKRVTLDFPPTPAELEQIKLGILKFLGQGILPNKDVLSHFVVALGDGRHSVVTLAERELKRLAGADDWNEQAVVWSLYSIFQGTVVLKGQPQVKPENKRSPASLQLRMKLLPYLLKSRTAASQFPSCIQVVFDCLYGTNTNMKLKTLAVQFVHHLCLFCPDAKFSPIGSVLLSGMVKLISEVRDNPRLRNLAYVAVGKIALRVPEVVTKDIALVQTFFEAMTKEDADNKLAVQEALSMMAEAFKNIDPANRKLLEALIMQNVESSDPQARLVAVQYASTVFPTDHIPSRYVLLLACGDMKESVYLEATKALRTIKKLDDPFKSKTEEENKVLLPAFTDMVYYINEQANTRIKSQHSYTVGNHVLPFNPASYGEILMYLRMCLAHEAGVEPMLETTSAMQEQAPVIAKCVLRLLEQSSGDKNPINLYMRIIQQILTAIGGAPAMYCLLEIVAVAREKLASQFVKDLDWIKTFMQSSREDMREFAAQLYALVVTNSCTPKIQKDIIQSLTTNVSNQALEGQHGSMLALGYLIGGIIHNQSNTGRPNDKHLQDAIVKATVKIAGMLDNSQPVLSGGACTALGEIGRNGAMPLQDAGDKKVTKLTITEDLIKKIQTTKENPKVREKAAVCLGYMCVGDTNFPHYNKVIEGILEAAQAKQIELHFSLGDSLACAALGPCSPEARDFWTTSDEEYKPPDGALEKSQVGQVLNLLLNKYSQSPNPHVRQAACIWLLSIAKKCGRHPVTQDKLMDIQRAFMRLLADSDDITQDISSKGLGVVYENCGEKERKELVSNLVDTLTGHHRKTQDVTSDTKLFEEGSIGQSPDGSNLSTYRELCSIASDLNQPDLVYKFMHLANHNAMWNSKRGAAFGFSTIASQAGEQLAPYLHKIIPKLYRYQFDPNPRINQAMSSIWSAVVPETQKTVDKYLKEIIDDLMLNLTANQWRVRESSCLALNDALRGRQLDEVVDKLPELWEVIVRVMDDIKETVRKAADTAAKTLSRVSIKMCDPNYGQVGSMATSMVLPCLLKCGLNSPVAEVRTLSLNTILKISKNAGVLLKPHIPVLVAALLESLSGLEPQQLNYISLHMGSEISQERLDTARIAAIKTSPMMETINLSVQYIDESIIPELVPRVVELIKSGIGLGTKAGCAHFIILLIGQCPRDITPYAGKLLAALLNGLHDRNVTVKKNYASAIGHVVKISKDNSVEKLLKRLLVWYMEKEGMLLDSVNISDDSIKMTCAATIHAMCMQSPDILQRHSAIAMPLAFLGMHEKVHQDEKKTVETSSAILWEEVWNDMTPGMESGLKLYMTEIVTLTKQALTSQSWLIKAQGAATMNTAAQKLGANLGPPHLGLVLDALLTGLQGRTWTGKEALLQALKSICVSCKDAVVSPASEDQPSLEKVVESLLKESGREKLLYKQEALQALCAILECHKLDYFNDVAQILYPMVKQPEEEVTESKEETGEAENGERMETEDVTMEDAQQKIKEVQVSEEEKKENTEKREVKKRRRRQEKREEYDVTHDTWLEFEQIVFECLGQAWPAVKSTQETHQEEFCQLLSVTLNTSVWKVDQAILKTLGKFYKRLFLLQNNEELHSSREKFLHMLKFSVPPLCQCLGNMKYSSVRTDALAVLEYIIDTLQGFEVVDLIEMEEQSELRRALQTVTRDIQPDLRDKASRLLKILPPPPPPKQAKTQLMEENDKPSQAAD